MSNKFFNFVYDPKTDGFSNSDWRLVYGDATISAGALEINKALIIHYGDITKGDAFFSLTMDEPAIGDNTRFGFTNYSKNAYASFNISDGLLSAEVSDGANSDSLSIDWDIDWLLSNTIEFRIKWESGTVSFFVNGVLRAAINSVSVPTTPMSLFVMSDNNGAIVVLNYIIVQGIQGYVFSAGNSDSSFEIIAKEADLLSISEYKKVVMADDLAASKIDNLSVGENVIVVRPELIFTKLADEGIEVSDVLDGIEIV